MPLNSPFIELFMFQRRSSTSLRGHLSEGADVQTSVLGVLSPVAVILFTIEQVNCHSGFSLAEVRPPQGTDLPSVCGQNGARERARLAAGPQAVVNAPGPPRGTALPIQTHLELLSWTPPAHDLGHHHRPESVPWQMRTAMFSIVTQHPCNVPVYFLHSLGLLVRQMVVIITTANLVAEII